MKKTLKIILVVVVVSVLGYAGFYLLASKGIMPIQVVPGARTLYEGQVEIEPISLSELKTKLEGIGCWSGNYQGATNPCWYGIHDDSVSISVYPHGRGFGPLSFTITGNTLKAQKDIPGTPDPEKYKVEVRKDVKDAGGAVTIKEDTWEITKTTYPWDVIY
jgi:hypothetical protein